MDDELSMSLEELISNDCYQWIFVGGKGGVGKTTTSCSVAVELAKRRESVLVLSTDPAHNLSDAFGQKLCGSPSLINGFSNLYAMEIDSTFQESSGYRLRDDDVWSKMLPELLQALPGIDEAISFTELMHSVQSMKYSVIVFDTAPTGHTLRLLGFPEVLEQGLKKFIALKSKLSGAIGMLNMVSGQTIDDEDISSKLNHLKAITTSIKETFQDPAKTTFVCVCIAEFLSVYETERLVQELAKQNIDCSNIVINQVLFPIDLETPSAVLQDEDELSRLRRENEHLKRKVGCCSRIGPINYRPPCCRLRLWKKPIEADDLCSQSISSK
eukprot:GHVQ01023351.1.p2 GENE.GHVQ01023351.1~~GHVQ01023351.1.p2  ORF type:complete len:327 (-),score=45.64 GHVQ01023351.1:1097-2077(-)